MLHANGALLPTFRLLQHRPVWFMGLLYCGERALPHAYMSTRYLTFVCPVHVRRQPPLPWYPTLLTPSLPPFAPPVPTQ